MKYISILIPKGQFSIVNIAGTFQILKWANDRFAELNKKPLFEIEFVGQEKPSNDSHGFYSIMPSKILTEVQKTDLIIIPAVHEDHEKAIELNRETMNWVVDQYNSGSEIAAYCIGVFLLADTGLLNNRVCSTHWGESDQLKRLFPKLIVESEKIITESGGIYTSGGAYAFTNLVIYLIEKYGGREVAIMTAKAFMIDVHKNDQSLFSIFVGQKNHGDQLVLEVQDFIEANYHARIGVDQIAKNKFTNRRTIERRFRAATGNSIVQYIQRVRIESAKKILEKGVKSVTEAMFSAGYNDTKAFREVFKKYVGVSPSEYKKKYSDSISLG